MKKIILYLLFIFISFGYAQQQTERFIIKNLKINNPYQNFGTSYKGLNRIIYSSQDSKNSLLDLYEGTIARDGEIINVKKLAGLNTKSNESNIIFTKDGKTVYFTRSLYGKKNTLKTKNDKLATIAIFRADVAGNGKWSNITALPFNGNYDVGHPTLNYDESKLYFTSNMPGTLGKTDIFVVDIHKDGTFSTPKNMGPKVNSKYKEMFPNVNKDNVLYFSSNRTDESYGGLDVFAVRIYENGDVSERLHLEPPINSVADDFSYIFDDVKKQGYFSSNRIRGVGSDDIYFFTETRPLLFDCYQEITGTVTDLQYEKPMANTEVTLNDANGILIEKTTTKKDGKFSFKDAVCDTPYQLLAKKRHYTEVLKNFTTRPKHDGQTLMNIELSDGFIVKRRGKRMLNIDVINFDYNSDAIRPDAANQLDRVVNTMNRYPKMIIELGTHTDSRGRNLYNLVLSNKRAKSVIKYITEHGISPDRISGKGYGEKRLLNHCKDGVKCTEKEHEINRRSEFVIIKM